MGGIGARSATTADQAPLTAGLHEPVEDHPFQIVVGQPGPEPGQHGRVEPGIGQLRAEGVLPVDRTDRHTRGLPVGQVLGELQRRDQRQHRRRQTRRPPDPERAGERLIGEHLGEAIPQPHRQRPPRKRRPRDRHSLRRDLGQPLRLQRHVPRLPRPARRPGPQKRSMPHPRHPAELRSRVFVAVKGDARALDEASLARDATLVTAHSEKEQAKPTFKRGFGFHPLWAFIDHGPDGTGEPAAVLLCRGNAGSNTAADHITVATAALAQLPRRLRRSRKVLIRTDGGGGTTSSSPGCTSAGWPTQSGSPSPTTTPKRSPHSRNRPGPRPTTPTTTPAPGRGSRNWPGCSTCPAGRRVWGSSSAANARTPAPSYVSPTSTATGLPRSRRTAPEASSPSWNSATAAGPAARTGSAAPRTPAWRTCPCTTSRRTRSGARSSERSRLTTGARLADRHCRRLCAARSRTPGSRHGQIR
ncbi:hypothetical protein FRAHR75_980002 [Frankia sp. Hr75.2]|nr:hypothetical protein FRAHR75_980002 [Frankia sp. Hr75.2]